MIVYLKPNLASIVDLLASDKNLIMFKIFRTKWFKSARIVATLWLSSTAVILIGINYVDPGYLFMSMS